MASKNSRQFSGIDKRSEDECEETERAAGKTNASTRIVNDLTNHRSAAAINDLNALNGWNDWNGLQY